MKRTVILFSFIFILVPGYYGQSELSVFNSTGRAGVATTFATDYQAIGINPANLGWEPKYEGKHVSFTLLETTASIYSEALSKPELRAVINDALDDNELDKFSQEEKDAAAAKFTASENAFNVDIMLLGAAVQTEKAGGFAFAVRQRGQYYSKFNENLSEIAFMGYNAPYFDQWEVDTVSGDTTGIATQPDFYSDLLEGSHLQLTWMNEYNLSYGRHIIKNDNFKLYGGVGIKYIEGLGIIDIRAASGDFSAFSAITPAIDIDYGDEAKSNPSYDGQNSGLVAEPVGEGFGFDIGFSSLIGEKLKIGVSLNDIGSVTWDGNVYEVKDDTLTSMSSDGFNSYNFVKEAEKITNEQGIFKWEGLKSKTIQLPTVLRGGASYQLIEKLEVGVDAVIPLNEAAGNYQNFLFAFGADFKPFNVLTVSSGFAAGGNYGFNVPLGLTFNTPEGTWEAGIASRDVITFFTDTGPTLSASFGFFRFRI